MTRFKFIYFLGLITISSILLLSRKSETGAVAAQKRWNINIIEATLILIFAEVFWSSLWFLVNFITFSEYLPIVVTVGHLLYFPAVIVAVGIFLRYRLNQSWVLNFPKSSKREKVFLGLRWMLIAQVILFLLLTLTDIERDQFIKDAVAGFNTFNEYIAYWGVGLGVFVIFFISIFTILMEEILFRGILYNALRTQIDVPLAITISSAFFMLYHDKVSFHIFGLGCVLAYIYDRSDGSLIASFSGHFVSNLIFYVFLWTASSTALEFKTLLYMTMSIIIVFLVLLCIIEYMSRSHILEGDRQENLLT